MLRKRDAYIFYQKYYVSNHSCFKKDINRIASKKYKNFLGSDDREIVS